MERSIVHSDGLPIPGYVFLVLGAILLGFGVWQIMRNVRKPDDPRRWAALEASAARSWLPHSYNWLVRGYRVNLVSFIFMGAGLCIWAVILMWAPTSVALLWAGFACMILMFATWGLAAIVARTGRPSALVPPPYRSGRQERFPA